MIHKDRVKNDKGWSETSIKRPGASLGGYGLSEGFINYPSVAVASSLWIKSWIPHFCKIS